MTKSRSTELATFLTSLPAGLLVALLALSAPEARPGPCTPGWETFDEPQTNVAYAVQIDAARSPVADAAD